MIIRPACDADLPAIVDIYNQSIPGRLATADTEPVTVEARREWFARHDASTYPVFVAEEDGAVIGWTSLSIFYGRPAYRRTAEVSTYVATAHHGRGLGTALRTHVLAAAKDLGFHTLLSFVFGHNAPSIRLNEKFGFTTWGHLPRIAVLDGIERDLLIMGRKL